MTEANGVKYIYDAQNRRIAKIDGGNTYVYIYHGWNVIAEYLIGYHYKTPKNEKGITGKGSDQ